MVSSFVYSRSLRWLLGLLVAAALLPAAPAAVAAGRGVVSRQTPSAPLQIGFSPRAPSWDEPVVLRIEGRDRCAMHQLSEPEVSFDTSERRWVIDVELARDGCGVDGPALPFALEVALGRLFPLTWLVRVHDPDGVAGDTLITAPEEPVPSAELKVYRRADLDLAPLPETPTDAAPFVLPVIGAAASPCFVLDEPAVEGDVIEVFFLDNCPILPPDGPHVFEALFEVGPLPAGAYEVRLVESSPDGTSITGLTKRSLVVHAADACVPSDSSLCLQGGRFRIAVSWRDFQGRTGAGHAVPLEDRDDSGLFWFFDEDNVELTVKVLDGCHLNGRWWVFVASGSTVEYEITVTDTLAGPQAQRIYRNELGETPSLIADTSAFTGCAVP